MNDAEFEILRDHLKNTSGLVVTPDKAYLLESRLLPIAREYGFADLSELAQKVKLKSDKALLKSVTEAMATHESSFMRDGKPFERFKKIILPQVMEKNSATRKIRIWSAACSSGQEPYSLSMLLKEEGVKLSGWTIEILATDISDAILEKAQKGVFTQFEVQRGLPIQMLVKYFEQEGEQWRIKPEIRNMVTFKNVNLLESLSGMGSFDVIFCRNVLIYFDAPTKGDILGRLCGCIKPDGFLVLGGAETVLGISDAWKSLPGQSGLYLPSQTDVSELQKKYAGVAI